MTERRIEQEELPPLPDDFDQAMQEREAAGRQLSEVRENGDWLLSFTDTLREMRLHNGFGPRLELAFQRKERNAS